MNRLAMRSGGQYYWPLGAWRRELGCRDRVTLTYSAQGFFFEWNEICWVLAHQYLHDEADKYWITALREDQRLFAFWLLRNVTDTTTKREGTVTLVNVSVILLAAVQQNFNDFKGTNKQIW